MAILTNNYLINREKPLIMHIDLNSCFATIEQQANPLLRGKPIVVAAYGTPNAFILAPSIEAKRLGIETTTNGCGSPQGLRDDGFYSWAKRREGLLQWH